MTLGATRLGCLLLGSVRKRYGEAVCARGLGQVPLLRAWQATPAGSCGSGRHCRRCSRNRPAQAHTICGSRITFAGCAWRARWRAFPSFPQRVAQGLASSYASPRMHCQCKCLLGRSRGAEGPGWGGEAGGGQGAPGHGGGVAGVDDCTRIAKYCVCCSIAVKAQSGFLKTQGDFCKKAHFKVSPGACSGFAFHVSICDSGSK